MASVAATQNLPRNQRLLAAQRYLYSRAKALSTTQAWLAGGTPVGGALAVAVCADTQPWVALAAVLVSLLDGCCLDSYQNRFRKAAANMQEEFDCDVLSLPWNDILTVRRTTAEEVYDLAKKYRPVSEAPLEDWYPSVVDVLPVYQARVICQRANCWWDAKQRHRYGAIVQIALVLVSIVVFVLGFLAEMDVQKFVLAVAAPLSPALLWGMREVRRQKESAASLDRVRGCGESLWNAVVEGRLVETEATYRSRQLQDAILLLRRSSPFVFDWIYRRLRRDYEDQMAYSADEMVVQATAAARDAPPSVAH